VSADKATAGPTLADDASRQEALDPLRSFVVQAPAGSGKTELLVRRFLVLLARAAEPESVLAMTFTRKAAGEMRERVAAALREAVSDEDCESDYRRQRIELARAVLRRSHDLGWGLLDDPSRLQIYTIDSLCARLAAALPLLSRFGARPRTIEDARPCFRQAARRTLAAASGSGDLAADLALLLERFEMKMGSVERQLVAMLGRREQWTPAALDAHSSHDDADLVDDFEGRFAVIMGEVLSDLAAACPPAVARAACRAARLSRDNFAELDAECPWSSLERVEQLSGSLDTIAVWRELAELLLVKKGTLRSKADKRQGAPRDSEAKEAFKALLEEAAAALGNDHPFLAKLAAMRTFPDSPRFSAEGRRALAALFHVLLACHAELWQVFRQRHEVDFTEVSLRAINALDHPSAPSDLLERLDHRISHLLVDEFQDTNVLQCDLIRCLTAAWSGGDGRTLFLVGDPMQSIYRFRKAEVGLFLQAASGTRLFTNVETEFLRLGVNFRSDRSIVDWTNACFAQAMGSDSDAGQGRVAYAPSQARDGADEGAPVELIGWTMAQSGSDEKNSQAPTQDAESEGLADLITTELAAAARERDGIVAVLVRSRKHAQALTAALRRRGVRYRAAGVDALNNRAVVRDLHSLTRFVVHRGDRLSGLALLRSPLVGLSLADLCLLVEEDVRDVSQRRALERDAQSNPGSGPDDRPVVTYASITELLTDEQALSRISEDGRVRLRRVRDILSAARSLLGRVSVAKIIESAFVELGAASTAGDTEVLDARAFFDVLSDCEQAAGLDCDELERRLNELTASADPDPSIVVELMTMHAAKGLEFDTVVLPSLGCKTQGGSMELVAYETEPASGRMTIVAPRPPKGRRDPDEDKFKLLTRREKARDDAESVRLIYVAATRAKHRLILSTAALGSDKDGGLKKPDKGSLLAALWPSLERVYQQREVALDNSQGETPQLTRVASDFCLPEAPAAVADCLRLYRPSDSSDDLGKDDTESSRLARHKGTVLHRWLEHITRDGLEGWDAERVHSERRRIERMLRSQGICVDELRGVSDEVVAALCRTLSDERGRWLLSQHDEGHCEWKLSRFGEAQGADRLSDLMVASIDRSFVDEDGLRWIVDYKSGGLPAESSLAQFLEERQRHYLPQLQANGELLHELEPQRSIVLALYFPEIDGGWCQWPF